MGTALATLSDAELAAEITTWAGRIAAGEARLLTLIGEYDDRGAWSGPGMLSCAHWLSWKLGMGPVAARERVRVARLLRELPLTSAAFSEGRLSWTQVRALTRCATAETEEVLLAVARSCTGAQIEKVARGLARTAAAAMDAVDPVAAEQRLRSRFRYDDDGTMVVTLRVPAGAAPVVRAGLDRVLAELQAERDQHADALAAELGEGLDLPPTRDPNEKDVTVDASAEAPVSAAGASAEASLRSSEAVDADHPEPLSPPPPGAVRIGQGSFAHVVAPALAITPAGAADASAEAPAPVSRQDREKAEEQARRRATAQWNNQKTLDASVRAQAVHDQIAIGKASYGDALIRLCTRALDTPHSTPVPKDTLTLHVDPLSGWARTHDGELLPPQTLPRPRTSASSRKAVVEVNGQLLLPPEITRTDLTVHDRGRQDRLVTGPLRRALGTLDGERCRFPGCPRNTKLHAHHVIYWTHGGRTDLDNLVLLCHRHHTLVHTEGFQLVLSPDRTLTVRTRDDIPVPHHSSPAWGNPHQLDPTLDIDEHRLPPQWHGEPLDLSYVTMVLLQHAA